MKTVIINGFSLGFAKNITGIQRACKELIYRLDEMANSGDFKIKYIYNVDDLNIVIKPNELKNIEVIPLKRDKKFLWKTRTIRKLMKNKQSILLNMSHETAFCKNQISFIYDARAAVTKFDPFKFRLKFKIYLKIQKHYAKYIFTDSIFQQHELARCMGISRDRIIPIYMGYEHYLDIKPDYNIFERFPVIKDKKYFYALGSLAPHKNFKWVAMVAEKNPDYLFVIAGGKDLEIWRDNIETKDVNNLIFVGYVSDGESKALMEKSEAFLHPSFYEGFGIPPLEALSTGTKIIISNKSCLPEIYEDSAIYFDPNDYDFDLISALDKSCASPQKILSKCSWDSSAMKLYDFLKNISKE